VALNAANEVAVERFLAGTLPFFRISEVVGQVLQQTPPRAMKSLDDLLAADERSRRQASEIAATLS
jgi:1-deoxy-D-xylulose-5-phosphate reductoisomerase